MIMWHYIIFTYIYIYVYIYMYILYIYILWLLFLLLLVLLRIIINIILFLQMWHGMLSDIVFVVRISYLDCVYSVNHWIIVLNLCRLASHELKHCPMEKVFLVAHLEPVLLVSFLRGFEPRKSSWSPQQSEATVRRFVYGNSSVFVLVNAVEIDCLTVFQILGLVVEFLQVHPTKENEYTTWKVDGATPMYWFYHGPLLIHLLGVAPSTFTTVYISTAQWWLKGFFVFASSGPWMRRGVTYQRWCFDESCWIPIHPNCPERTDRSDSNLWDAVDVLGKPDTNKLLCMQGLEA